jgi:tRNA A37 N6-isopentenylltransferase MiaA
VQAQPLSLDEKCKLEETIQRVATNTIGYTKKQANKEWFDEKCAKVNEEKNTATESEPSKSKPEEQRMLTN